MHATKYEHQLEIHYSIAQCHKILRLFIIDPTSFAQTSQCSILINVNMQVYMIASTTYRS